MPKPRCKFGVDTCDGINGTSGFICRDCVEAGEFDKQLEKEAKMRGEGGPACEVIEPFEVAAPLGTCKRPHKLKRVSKDRGSLIQDSHKQEESCIEWLPDGSVE